ncbi:MAG TPA: hypothetical protein VLF68_01710 [Candidatus Saccharimonadales bacterium]|nr:hypothetical protein [Candidatus Saccharimonadales bacterium]
MTIAERSSRPDIKAAEPLRVAYDVPLVDLLGDENKDNPIASDHVSIYSIPRPGGQEYVIAFPPLTGKMLHNRLSAISSSYQGMYGVYIDIDYILNATRNIEGAKKLEARHAKQLGVLWEMFFHSLPQQRDLFSNEIDYKNISGKRQSLQDKIDDLSPLPELTLQPYVDVTQEAQRAMRMLNGEVPADFTYLTRFFHIGDAHLAQAVFNQTRRYGGTRRRTRNNLRQVPHHVLAPYALEAAREKVRKPKTAQEPDAYDEEKIMQYADTSVKKPLDQFLLREGTRYFTIPKQEPIKSIHRIGMYSYRFVVQGKTQTYEVDISIGDSSVIEILKRRYDPRLLAEELAALDNLQRKLLVPLCRIGESSSGQRGLIFDELGPKLPEEVSGDILQRAEENKTDPNISLQVDTSGMVGIDMLVAAHPSIRKIDDEWSKIWKKERITRPEVMGDMDPNPHAPTQINGPAQVGIIALAAAARYPEQFDTFFDRVKEAVA